MENYHIRPGTHHDFEQWLMLRQGLWPDCPEPRHRLEMDQILTSSGGVFIAENKDSRLIGFVEFSVRKDYVPGSTGGPVPYLEGWYVDKASRRTGVGHSLLKTLEEWARGRGYKQLASDANIYNTLSIEVHKASGFREVEREVHFIKSLEYNNPL